MGDGSTPDSSGFQWSVGVPSGFTAASAIGSAAASAGKNILACSTNSPLVSTCVLVGMNVTVVGNGTLAVYTVSIPANAPVGLVSFPLSGLISVMPNGSMLTPISGPLYNLSITAPPPDKRDISGPAGVPDGRVDDFDVRAMAIEVVASRAAPASCLHDQNSDGVCTLMDVQAVLDKALGRVP